MTTPTMCYILKGNPDLACISCGAMHKQTIGGIKRLLTKDHIIPQAEGGDDTMENIQILCNVCHRIKTRQDGNKYNNRKMQECKLLG